VVLPVVVAVDDPVDEEDADEGVEAVEPLLDVVTVESIVN
jgi:hypothetical protein